MDYLPLGRTDLEVSRIGLGTMTFGQQNSEAEAHQQIDYALERGINFIDTAEMYPVPPMAETQGRTEAYIGSWLKQYGRRDQIILASKVTGPGEIFSYLRGGNLKHNRQHIEAALNDSLKRLNTDYLDLYQIHWPERSTNFFGKLGYQHAADEDTTPILETLQVLSELVRDGRVRHIGVSNESPWGVHEYLRQAEREDLPRVQSIQNPYNLVNRSFEVGLAEFSHREDVGLLAYSPLGFGALSGKYLNGQRPPGARLTLWDRFSRYTSAQGERAIARYVELAQQHGLDPAQMALAWVNSRPFLTSTLIGATSMDQLKVNIDSIDVVLSDEVLQGIEDIHRDCPNPSP